jgi:predicted nucleotidyltransferase
MDKRSTLKGKEEALRVAHAYADVVKSQFAYSRMILFGSYAKGNFTEDSDIDVAILFKDYDDRHDMQVALMVLCLDVDTRIEPHPFRENEFEANDPLVYEIMKYGQEIM